MHRVCVLLLLYLQEYISGVSAVLDVLAARSRRLGVQYGIQSCLACLCVYMHPLGIVAVLVLLVLLVLLAVVDLQAMVLPVDLVFPVAGVLPVVLLPAMAMALLPVALLPAVLLPAALLPVAVGEVLLVAGLLRQELRLPLVAAEAAAAAPLGSGEM